MASPSGDSPIDTLEKRSRQTKVEAALAPADGRKRSPIRRLLVATRRGGIAKAKATAEASRDVEQGHRGPVPTRNINTAPHRHQPEHYPTATHTGNNINLNGNSVMQDPTIQSGSGNILFTSCIFTKIVHNYYCTPLE